VYVVGDARVVNSTREVHAGAATTGDYLRVNRKSLEDSQQGSVYSYVPAIRHRSAGAGAAGPLLFHVDLLQLPRTQVVALDLPVGGLEIGAGAGGGAVLLTEDQQQWRKQQRKQQQQQQQQQQRRMAIC